MKHLFLIALLTICAINNIHSQPQNHKKMAQFNIEQYKDWEDDSYYPVPEDKFLKKGDERVRITTLNNEIDVDWSNINSPITYQYMYDKKTETLLIEGQTFYTNVIFGIWKYYDTLGRLTKQVDTDSGYTFSIKDLVHKFKKEYNVDIQNPKNVLDLNRYQEKQYLHIPIYEIGLNTNTPVDSIEAWDIYLINGNTGKTLYTIRWNESMRISVLEEYLKSIHLMPSDTIQHKKEAGAGVLQPNKEVVTANFLEGESSGGRFLIFIIVAISLLIAAGIAYYIWG